MPKIRSEKEMMMTRIYSNLMLLFAAVLWGAGNASQKLLLDNIGPLTAIAFRCLIAALVIAPFCWREPAKTGTSPEKRLLAIVITGCFGVALTLYQIAFETTSVTNSGFLVNTCSVMTPLAAWWIMRSPPAFSVWPAAGTALCGIYFMSGGATVGLTIGDGLSLLSAIFYALWMVLLGQYVIIHGGARRLTLVQLFGTGCAALGLALLTETISLTELMNAAPHLLFVGVVSTGGAYLLQAIAQQHTCASEAAIIVSSEAIFGAIGGYLIFGDRLHAWGYAGAGMIMLAIVMIEISPILTQRLKRPGAWQAA